MLMYVLHGSWYWCKEINVFLSTGRWKNFRILNLMGDRWAVDVCEEKLGAIRFILLLIHGIISLLIYIILQTNLQRLDLITKKADVDLIFIYGYLSFYQEMKVYFKGIRMWWASDEQLMSGKKKTIKRSGKLHMIFQSRIYIKILVMWHEFVFISGFILS